MVRKNFEDLSVLDKVRMACENPQHLQPPDLRNHKEYARTLRGAVYSSAYFEVGNDVVEAAMTLGQEHPDILVDLLPRCRPPFPRTILEWDSHHALRFAGQEPEPHAPKRVAAVVEEEPGSAAFYITIMGVDNQPHGSEGSGDWKAGISPISYRVSPDEELTGHHSPVHDIIRQGFLDESTKDINGDLREEVLKLGCPPEYLEEPTYHHVLMIPMILGRFNPKAYKLWESARELSKHVNLDLCHLFHNRMEKGINNKEVITWREASWAGRRVRTSTVGQMMRWNILTSGIKEDMGLGRKVLGILALLNAKDREVAWSEPYTPPGRLHAGPRMIPYFARRKLTLLLPHAIVLRRIVRKAIGERKKKRRHPVIGHWCSSRKRGQVDCNHQYDNINPKLKTCTHCGHIVWWKESHLRGDASQGFVEKTYELRKRPKVSATFPGEFT